MKQSRNSDICSISFKDNLKDIDVYTTYFEDQLCQQLSTPISNRYSYTIPTIIAGNHEAIGSKHDTVDGFLYDIEFCFIQHRLSGLRFGSACDVICSTTLEGHSVHVM